MQKFHFRLGRDHINEVKVNYWQADRASLVSVCMKVGIKTLPGVGYPEVPCVVPTCRLWVLEEDRTEKWDFVTPKLSEFGLTDMSSTRFIFVGNTDVWLTGKRPSSQC